MLACISHSKCFWMMNEIPLWKNKKHRNNIQYHSFLDTLLIAWIRNLILICVIHEVNMMLVECCWMPGYFSASVPKCYIYHSFVVVHSGIGYWNPDSIFIYKCDFKMIVDFGFVGGFFIMKNIVCSLLFIEFELLCLRSAVVICFGFHFIWLIWASQMSF